MSLKKIGEVRDLFDPDHGDLLGVAGKAVHHGGALLAAGHSLAPASGHSSLDLIGDIVNMDIIIMETTALTLELLSSRNRTSSSSLILRIVLICFLMKAHSMVQPLYGGCVRCCVLQSGDWSHGERMGGWWRPGLGPPLYCLHPPSQTRAHGAAAAPALCITLSGLFVCK